MRFEEEVMFLCAQAIAVQDEAAVRKILEELRLVLHRRIEHLRSNLPASFPAATAGTPLMVLEGGSPRRTWQDVVHDITIERDPQRAVQLSRELGTLLEATPAPRSEDDSPPGLIAKE